MTRADRIRLVLAIVVTLAGCLWLVHLHDGHRPAGHDAVQAVTYTAGVDDAHLIRAAELRANRDLRRHALAHERAVERQRAAAAAAARAQAAAERAARARYVSSDTSGVPAVWQRVAACESSGHWHDNTGNGFYGGLQITAGNAGHYGFARPDLLSPPEQVRLARLILRDQGPGAWPVCGPRAGLQRGD